MPPRTTPARRSRRWWNRLPLRIRLVAGFAAAMLLVLTGAGAFVYLRVQYALDLRLDEDLTAQSSQLVHDVTTHTPPTVAPGSSYQLLDAGNRVLAGSSGLARTSLLLPAEAAAALRRPVREDRGDPSPCTPSLPRPGNRRSR
jgi:two-component system OmpR family sensor kinase